MWIELIMLNLLLAVILHVLLRTSGCELHDTFAYTYLIAFGAWLGNSTPLRHQPAAIKILHTVISAYGIIFGVIFSCSLVSVLTRPRHQFQVDSVSSAYDRGYRFASGNIALARIKSHDDEVHLTT